MQEIPLSQIMKNYMKIKIYKAPSNLNEKVANKINLLECFIDLGDLFFKNLPIWLISILSIKNKNKK